MRRLILAGLVAAVAIPSAMAVQVKTGNTWGPYQAGLGGEFTLTSVGLDVSAYSAKASGFINNAGTPTFQTFCLESSTPPEYIYQNTTYNVVVNDKAVWGGNVNGGGDTLSKGTGWLYSQFATGTLSGYNYGENYGGTVNGRQTSAGLLQNALWWLENEGGISYDASNPFMFAAFDLFGGEAGARADGASGYGVKALNMTKLDGTMSQDQLYYQGVPDGGVTLVLLGLGVSGVAFISRRSRR